ncbi:MAG: signal peptidase II [Dehalococcoidales bacterium]
MEEVNHRRFNRRDLFFAAVVLVVIAADQLIKLWIRTHLQVGGVLWDAGLFRIIRVQNTGAAFGIFKGHTHALIVVDFIGIFVLLFLVFGLRNRWPFIDKILVRLGVGLILGGTIGNLIDRLRVGQVTDFIDLKLWPVFNLSDASVTIGVIILAYCLIFMADRAKIQE